MTILQLIFRYSVFFFRLSRGYCDGTTTTKARWCKICGCTNWTACAIPPYHLRVSAFALGDYTESNSVARSTREGRGWATRQMIVYLKKIMNSKMCDLWACETSDPTIIGYVHSVLLLKFEPRTSRSPSEVTRKLFNIIPTILRGDQRPKFLSHLPFSPAAVFHSRSYCSRANSVLVW